jgi:hypothetical protein
VLIWPVGATGTASPDTLTVYHHVGCKASGPKASQARAWGLASITAKVTGRRRHWPRRRAVSPQILRNRNHHGRSSARQACDTPCEWPGICDSWGRSEALPRHHVSDAHHRRVRRPVIAEHRLAVLAVDQAEGVAPRARHDGLPLVRGETSRPWQ